MFHYFYIKFQLKSFCYFFGKVFNRRGREYNSHIKMRQTVPKDIHSYSQHFYVLYFKMFDKFQEIRFFYWLFPTHCAALMWFNEKLKHSIRQNMSLKKCIDESELSFNLRYFCLQWQYFCICLSVESVIVWVCPMIVSDWVHCNQTVIRICPSLLSFSYSDQWTALCEQNLQIRLQS